MHSGIRAGLMESVVDALCQRLTDTFDLGDVLHRGPGQALETAELAQQALTALGSQAGTLLQNGSGTKRTGSPLPDTAGESAGRIRAVLRPDSQSCSVPGLRSEPLATPTRVTPEIANSCRASWTALN